MLPGAVVAGLERRPVLGRTLTRAISPTAATTPPAASAATAPSLATLTAIGTTVLSEIATLRGSALG